MGTIEEFKRRLPDILNLTRDEIFIYTDHGVARDFFSVVHVDWTGMVFLPPSYCFEQQLNLHQTKNSKHPASVFYVGQLDKRVYFSFFEALSFK